MLEVGWKPRHHTRFTGADRLALTSTNKLWDGERVPLIRGYVKGPFSRDRGLGPVRPIASQVQASQVQAMRVLPAGPVRVENTYCMYVQYSASLSRGRGMGHPVSRLQAWYRGATTRCVVLCYFPRQLGSPGRP